MEKTNNRCSQILKDEMMNLISQAKCQEDMITYLLNSLEQINKGEQVQAIFF